MGSTSFQAPTGTRDFYPIELARRRYIERAWRAVSVRHGFEEIDGPTFESIDLYKAKSGEGIVSEIFHVHSGKDERSRAGAEQGGAREAPFALRPEFTPTLARMYASRAAQLPRPCKWFWQQSCFRAERPQRGRLREFMQWNCDIIGDGSPAADAEAIGVCVGLLEELGLTPEHVKVRFNHRGALAAVVSRLGVDEQHMPAAFVLLDRRDRLSDDDLEAMAFEFGITSFDFLRLLKRPRNAQGIDAMAAALPAEVARDAEALLEPLRTVESHLAGSGVGPWCSLDLNVARGLAYYTGMVFEVHEISGAMRAVAGGGRYDNLIETFGGPATPAVGFGMGDVVLSLVLQDKGLMPGDREIARALGLRPDVQVISNGSPESDALVPAVVGELRRAGVHARRSYKATKNIGKLLKEAADADARYAVIIESASEVTVKNLDDGTQVKAPRADLRAHLPPAR